MSRTCEPMDQSDLLAPEPPASDVLESQIHALENQIAHLTRSNAEMEEHMAAAGFDKELRVAIGENIVAIARRKAILEDMCKARLAAAPQPVAEERPGVYL
mmetsp:Transcript_16546/g.41712  ORF Transcript_16546/g.41712 Transcript_16546/m.41712 type:complete len:101 (-) Transcript_16546:51-353(-)